MQTQMKNLMYLLLHFLTGQTRPERSRRMWQSGIVVHDAPGTCLAMANAATPAAAADTARRLLAAWNACDGIPTAALEAGAVKNLIAALRALNVDRALLPLNARDAQSLPALLSVECVETARGFADDDDPSASSGQAAPDFADDVSEEEYDAVCCAKNGEEYDAGALCAECGHSVTPGSGRFVNRVPIFDSYDTRCEMGYSYPAGAYICPECEQAINEKCADY